MNSVSRFLLIALALISVGAHASPVATTAGSNLTAYNSSAGAANNNAWNNMINPRSGGDSMPTADFGNCNALILRCAQPKCANGGCTDMNVTSAIVSGCVNSNDTCKQYGTDLVNYISAQLVAQSTARANQAEIAAQTAAAQQNNQQMAVMQEQMMALQQQIAESNANMQAAIEAQQQAAAQAIADAAATSTAQSSYSDSDVSGATADTTELTAVQQAAVESGVSEDLIMREQISGQILTQIENAEKSLKTLKVTMENAFEYAGCDKRGDNCSGPKRVKKFKDLAGQFFDPYEDVLDDLYEAIILAQSVGVDVSNIYMLLNNSCNQWGKYACSKPLYTVNNSNSTNAGNKNLYVWPRYDSMNCPNGRSVAGAPIYGCNHFTYDARTGTSTCAEGSYSGTIYGSVKGGQECSPGQTIPPEDDTSCTYIGNLNLKSGNDTDGISRSYLYTDESDMGDMVRVGCTSNALNGSWLFKNKKQKASIDIETLQRIIEQDGLRGASVRRSKNDLAQREQVKYCALTEDGYMNLQKYVGMRGLPTKNICVNERILDRNMDKVYVGESESLMQMAIDECAKKSGYPVFSEAMKKCFCYKNDGTTITTGSEADACDQAGSMSAAVAAEKRICEKNYYAKYHDSGRSCDCNQNKYEDEDTKESCHTFFDGRSILKLKGAENTPSSSDEINVDKNRRG